MEIPTHITDNIYTRRSMLFPVSVHIRVWHTICTSCLHETIDSNHLAVTVYHNMHVTILP